MDSKDILKFVHKIVKKSKEGKFVAPSEIMQFINIREIYQTELEKIQKEFASSSPDWSAKMANLVVIGASIYRYLVAEFQPKTLSEAFDLLYGFIYGFLHYSGIPTMIILTVLDLIKQQYWNLFFAAAGTTLMQQLRQLNETAEQKKENSKEKETDSKMYM